MNPILLPPEDTRTIKYAPHDNNLVAQNSERATERKCEQQISKNKRITNGSKLCPQQEFHSKAQVRKNVDNQREISHHMPTKKTQHKKGKSMNLEELDSSEKSERLAHAVQIDNVRDKGKVTINMNFINQFRSRNSSSEMKQYLHSKRYTASKKNSKDSPLIFKKKKAKSTYDGQLKQVKKEIKHILEATLKKKEKGNAKSQKVNKLPTSDNSARLLKNSAKNHELSQEFKSKSTQRERLSSRNTNDFKNISYTLPITAKMASLYSNTSSVFNSTEQLERVDHVHSYVIPTEQSIDEIPEIRKFQSLASKKMSSGSLKNMRKVRLVQELEENEDVKTEPTTQDIINKYLEMLKNSENSHQIFSQQFSQIDQIPSQNRRGRIQQKQQRQQPIHQGLIQYSDGSQPKFQMSSLLPYETEDIKAQQKEIGKLNEIIQMIGSEELNRKLNPDEKTTAIMQRIKQLIGQPINSTELNQEVKLIENVPVKGKEKSIEQHSSIGSEDSAQNALNLEMLDRALRERHSYLLQKRDSELQRLQDIDDEEEFQVERERILKWMNSQIKEVVHTRHQLWKGFNLAKNLLQEDHPGKSSESSGKKREMMRCLSDKYLSRHHKHKKEKKEKESKLQQGRITKVEEKDDNKGQKSSVVKPEVFSNAPNEFIDSEDEDSYQEIHEQNLLNSCVVIDLSQIKSDISRRQGNKEKQVKIDQQQQKPEHHQQKKLFQSTDLNNLHPIQSIPVSESSGGLNLQKIVYEIQCQDSFNQEELQQLANKNIAEPPQTLESIYKLTEQDKEDIYEFIFLDLCIELTEEYPIDSPLMRKIFAFTKKIKDQSKKQKGFKTNTTAIKDYLFQLISFIKEQPDLLDEVHCNIDKPLGPTALDILKYMHVYDEESPEEESEQTVFIMDITIFQQFQKIFLQKLQFQKYYEDEDKEKKRKMFLKNAIHIHNKSIFDALNETLDKHRPFGVWGEPFSWKKTAKFFHPRDKATKNNIILKCAQKAVECGAFVCGFMVDKQDCNFKDNPNVTQAYIESIRDDRLSRMLANDLEQSEQKMLFIDDEQTEILVQVANSILQTLFLESIRQISSMF